MRLRRGFAPRATALVVALAAASVVGVHTSRGATLTSASACPEHVLEQPFLPWLDPAYYALVPDGALEESPTRWNLAGATIVTGNEIYYVHSTSDSHSLSLPSGSSATTAPMCVGAGDPTLRLFVVNDGSLLSTLEVEVVYTDLLGVTRVAPVALLTGTASWQPTLAMPFLAGVTSLQVAADGTTTVAFRFTPHRKRSGWRIDDVYVDPFKGV